MSRKEVKTYSNYRESDFKIENEPEEGEIIDEYDLIVSSDEELSMRQRIRELEAENEEIEQIAVISRSYVDKINPLHTHLENSRAAQVPTDVSSISSTEFVTPKKRKRRKSREHKRKHCHHQHQHQHQHHHQYETHPRYVEQEIPLRSRSRKTHCKRRQKLFAKKHQKVHSDRYLYKEINAETVSLDSPESSDSSSSLTDTENFSKSYFPFSRKDDKYISRDTLRLAVARNSNESIFPSKKSCLKDKLLRQELVGQPANIPMEDERQAVSEAVNVPNENAEQDDDDDDVQVIENEPDIQTIDEDSTDSLEEKELRLIALKSAVLKKHMARKMRNAEAAYSPTDFDEMLASGNLPQDNKLDDLEVVDLDAEDSQNACVTVSPVASPQLMILEDQEESQQMVDCKPIDMDIANSDSDDTTVGSWSKEVEPVLPTFPLMPHDFANNFQYGYYMPDLHELPPPPPGVDDYEDAPPPPPYHKMYASEMQDMELDSEEISESQHWLKHNINYTHDINETLPEKTSSLPPTVSHKEDVEDEEEEALRALLLSKFQSPKNQKKSKRSVDATESHDISNSNVLTEQSNAMPKKPTEFILKEAVKRLKIHSQTELCKEESSVEFDNPNKLQLPTKPLECNENNHGSLTLLEKLRNRLNKYKNQAQVAEHVCQEVRNENIEDEKDSREHFGETIENAPNNYKCSLEDDREHQESFSNTLEVANTNIDINDITRRLQQIKENVLNSINKKTTQEPPVNLDSKPQVTKPSTEEIITEIPQEDKTQPVLENITELQKPFHNNLDNIVSKTTEINTNTAAAKTVEANFDATTKQTTFKVTITNGAVSKPENSDMNVSVIDPSLKENKANNLSKNVKLKVNVNSKSKVTFNSERVVKIINKTTESSAETKGQVVKSSAVIKPIANKAQVTAVSTYPLLRPTKIVKPNKVINTNFDLNRRQISQATESTLANKPTETTNPLPNATDNPRLITSLDQVKHMFKVAPFVISVQNSSNESSEDECSGEYDSLYKPLYDYNDNASPLSLTLESPVRTPLRSNSPTEPGMEGNTINKDMERKLDTFLKKAKIVAPVNHQSNDTNQGEKTNKTPLAVRHLPAAAQSEYRRLVHRMKLLENKRKSTNDDENPKDCSTTNKIESDSPLKEDLSTEKDKGDATSSTPKTSLVKKVLIRNATTTNESQVANGSTVSPKFHKSNVLRSYENLYVKFGAGIVNNLDKSLKLVEEAKKAKITKLKLETRLKELKAEMDILQSKHKEEQQKISRIYPSICSTNEVITSLKQKRSKVFKAALNLGKTLKGEDYRLNNDLKESITTKSKQLATEIKIVNSLKAQDVSNIENALKPGTSPKELTDNKKKTAEDCKTKSNSENIDTKLKADTAVVSDEREKEKEEEKRENKIENPLQSEVGGNTEFQNMEDHDTIIPVKNEDTSRPDVDTKTDYRDTKTEDSKEASTLPSYISPLEHLRNIDSNMDPNGVVCPYDLMGNCEDVTCKYVHITPKAKT
ncbi:titin [Lucilia sericata]|uniref:titin n=1 Tax=Lucilia sericata TaxID=13632 RepID=UPI0018A7EBF7|nr:titin [Lucilia sericata]